MIIVTTDTISGRNLATIGLVRGASIMTVHAGKDIMNGLKTLLGGELTSYNQMMEKARGLATERMIAQAESMGADAIVGTRYSSSAVTQGAAEVMAYGTAVKFV